MDAELVINLTLAIAISYAYLAWVIDSIFEEEE